MILVPLTRNVDRSAQCRAACVVAIPRTLHAVAVAEEIVGVQRFIAQKVIAAAVKILSAGLGDHLNHRAPVTGVFGLIAIENHLHLADSVQRGDTRKHTRRPLVVAHHAIHREDVRTGQGSADVRRACSVLASHRILVRLILHAGDGAKHRDNIPAARRQVLQLAGGQNR